LKFHLQSLQYFYFIFICKTISLNFWWVLVLTLQHPHFLFILLQIFIQKLSFYNFLNFLITQKVSEFLYTFHPYFCKYYEEQIPWIIFALIRFAIDRSRNLKIRSEFTKELSLWNKIEYLNLNIFRIRWCKPLKFQTQIIWSNRIHSLKYLKVCNIWFQRYSD